MAPPRGNGGTTGDKGDGRSEQSLRRSIKKRTKGLSKKACELALACHPSQAAGPTTWPPDRSKIEDTIHHYFETPAHQKLPKNQITPDNPKPGADEKKDTAKAAAEEADRLRIPFPDDEDKLRELGRILASRLEAVRKMIAIRQAEGRRDPTPSTRDSGKKLPVGAASTGGGDPRQSGRHTGKKLAGDRGGPPAVAEAVKATSASGGDPWTSDRDRGKRVAGDYGPVWGRGHPGFSAVPAAAGRGDGGAPNYSYPCPCRNCPFHNPRFTGSDGRSLDPTVWGRGDGGAPNSSHRCPCHKCPLHHLWFTGSNGR